MTRSSVQGEDTDEGATDAPDREEAVRGDGDNGVEDARSNTRDDGGSDDGEPEGPRPTRRRRRVLRWTAVVLAVVLAGTAGAGYLYYEHLNDNIKQDVLNLGDSKVAAPTPNAAGQTP
ncbi:LytR family transcriptional regulator, partial [Streptomyces scabiei]